MATIQKRGTSYKITVSSGYDLSGKQIRHTMTWSPPDGMTKKQIQKEVNRQAVLFEEKVRTGQVLDGNIKGTGMRTLLNCGLRNMQKSNCVPLRLLDTAS